MTKPTQALLAAKAGTTYVSPFIGRLDDTSQTGMDLAGQIVTILKNYGFGSRVIVSSIRHPIHVLETALIGADVATIPYKVMEQLVQHPLTIWASKSFWQTGTGFQKMKSWQAAKNAKL